MKGLQDSLATTHFAVKKKFAFSPTFRGNERAHTTLQHRTLWCSHALRMHDKVLCVRQLASTGTLWPVDDLFVCTLSSPSLLKLQPPLVTNPLLVDEFATLHNLPSVYTHQK